MAARAAAARSAAEPVGGGGGGGRRAVVGARSRAAAWAVGGVVGGGAAGPAGAPADTPTTSIAPGLAHDHLRATLPAADRSADPHALALVEPLRLARQVGDQRDQEDDAERLGVVRRELEHARVGLEARLHDVALDRDDVADVAARRACHGTTDRAPTRDARRASHAAQTTTATSRNAPPHGRTALAGGGRADASRGAAVGRRAATGVRARALRSP